MNPRQQVIMCTYTSTEADTTTTRDLLIVRHSYFAALEDRHLAATIDEAEARMKLQVWYGHLEVLKDFFLCCRILQTAAC